jgi:hypothetical protein
MEKQYIEIDGEVFRLINPIICNGFEMGLIFESTNHLYEIGDDFE